MEKNFLILLLGIVMCTMASATELSRNKIVEWREPNTNPQTRMHCAGETSGKMFRGGKWSSCTSWTTDTRTMQVVVFARLQATDTLSQATLTLANLCASLAETWARVEFAKIPSTALNAGVAPVYSTASRTFKQCLIEEAGKQAANVEETNQLKLSFVIETYWSDWSNGLQTIQ